MADIAIVGIGAVFPGAGDAPTFWQNVRSGVDAITEVPPDRWDPEIYYRPGEDGADRFYCRRGGFVNNLADFDPGQFGIMPAAVDSTEPDQLLILRAAAEAIADSGGLPARERVGVIIGRGGYLTPGVARLDQQVHTVHQVITVLRDLAPELSPGRLEAVRAAFAQRLGPDRADPPIGLVPNFAASRVANRFDLRGPAYTVDAACASSLLAVDHAVGELTSGRCDAVLTGGVHICHHPVLWSLFTQLRALSPGGTIRPFDARADGTLLSEGAGALLLKRLTDAMDAGDRIYAVIRGVGVASDGRATSMMNPLADGQELAIRRAWAAAGLNPGEPGALGLLEAHGTATPTGDQVELETLTRVFGPPAGRPAGVGTVKSMIGHAMPAAGMAGLIKAAFAIHDGVLPPTLNIAEPHPALARTRFEPITREQPWDENLPRRAAVNAFGFGGINAHVIIESPQAGVRGQASRPGPQRRPDAAAAFAADEVILRLAAGSPGQLAEALNAPDAELLGRAGREPDPGNARLAIVAPDSRKLAVARKVVARGTPWRGRSDIWFTPVPLLADPGQVAFLFPGFEPEFAPRIEGVARHFGLPVPVLRGGQAGDDPRAGVVEHGLDMIAVSRLLAQALGELGIAPGVLAGHSLGEWTAMIVAGVYPEIDAFLASMRSGMVEVPDVVYAAIGLGADRVGELAVGHSDIVLTHDNCPHQSVVCGPAGQVADVVARARAAGILARPLPFRTGFHSPMYAPYLAAARETLRQLEVQPGAATIWSATTLAPFPRDPAQVRELVLRHLVEPVRFRQLTKTLHEAGVRAFVQVGPGSLTAFVDDTLAGRDHITVATSVPKRGGLAQLRRAAAALWAEGLSPRFERLVRTPTPGGSVRLRLGAPLVRLTGITLTTAQETSAGAAVGLPDGTPVLAELSALLAETNAAAGTVARGLAHLPPGNGLAPAGRAPGSADEITMTREFSLRTMPDVIDHGIVPQPEGWPEASDRFPVVPLTLMLEVMADAALELAPGRVVAGFDQVVAARWLPVAPATTAPVHAARDGADRVRVRIESYASCCVLLGDAYLPPPAPTVAPSRNVRAAPVSARELYAQRYMFHGPRFAGIADIVSLADDGMTAAVISLPARGALLDSAGQLIGHWIQVTRDRDQSVLPTGVRRIRFYGPQPPPGARIGCTAWIHEVTDAQMRGDAELCHSDGQLWARIEDWTTRRFTTDEPTWRVRGAPERNTVCELGPDGWNVLWERWPDTASRELMMRWYLNAADRARFEALHPLARRQWLLDAMAVKDSVRRWLWNRGAGPIFPAEVTLDGPDDNLQARGPFRAPRVSLAHCPPEGRGPSPVVATAAAEAREFTVSIGHGGTLLVEQSGRPARTISTAIPVAAATAKGHS